MPVFSLVRKTNPRAVEDLPRRIFRRGYPLIDATVDGLRGLILICFGRTISTQFEFMTGRRTINPEFPRPGSGVDPLRQFERVLCGGYFFVPVNLHASRMTTTRRKPPTSHCRGTSRCRASGSS